MSAEDKEKLRVAMDVDLEIEQDPNSHLDYLKDPISTLDDDEFSKLKEPKNRP